MLEREIRFRVTAGRPPTAGRRMVQRYLLRGRATLRVRVAEGRDALRDGAARALDGGEPHARVESWVDVTDDPDYTSARLAPPQPH